MNPSLGARARHPWLATASRTDPDVAAPPSAYTASLARQLHHPEQRGASGRYPGDRREPWMASACALQGTSPQGWVHGVSPGYLPEGQR